MTSRRKRVRPKPGDVVAIPLPRSRFAFGRLLHDAGIAIYDLITTEIPSLDELQHCGFRFYSGVFDTAIRSGDWPRIGHIGGRTDDDDWQPPCYIQDELQPGRYEIYHRGAFVPQPSAKSEAWRSRSCGIRTT